MPAHRVILLAGLLTIALLGLSTVTAQARSLFDDPDARPAAPAAVPSWWRIQHAERAWMRGVTFSKPLSGADGETLRQGLDLVNRQLNKRPYRQDQISAGRTNHWARPQEFFAAGGDCEDFAVAKYFALRALGLDAAAMRIVVVRDRRRGQDHAVLLVRSGDRAYVLDNLHGDLVLWRTLDHYRPVYSVNESGAWLHYGTVRNN